MRLPPGDLPLLPATEPGNRSAEITSGAGSSDLLTSLTAGNRDLLIGKAAEPGELELIRSQIEAAGGVAKLVALQTMHAGPDHLIVAAQVAVDDGISADQAEDVADTCNG